MAGVGGRTVAEAKARLTYAEVRMWELYRIEHGPLSPLMRSKLEIEHMHFAGAQICTTIARSAGAKNLKIADFMPALPWLAEPEQEEEKEATIEDLMAVLRAARVK